MRGIYNNSGIARFPLAEKKAVKKFNYISAFHKIEIVLFGLSLHDDKHGDS